MCRLQPVNGDGLLPASVVDDKGLVSPADDAVWASVGWLKWVAVCIATDKDVRCDSQRVRNERCNRAVLRGGHWSECLCMFPKLLSRRSGVGLAPGRLRKSPGTVSGKPSQPLGPRRDRTRV